MLKIYSIVFQLLSSKLTEWFHGCIIGNNIIEMKKIRLLRSIVFLENLLCIYRNFLFFNKKARAIILIHITIELVLYVLSIVNNSFIIYSYFHSDNRSMLIVFTTICCFYVVTFVSIVMGILRSEEFKDLVTSLELINKFFTNNKTYLKSLGRSNTMIIAITTILYCVTCIGIAVDKITLNDFYEFTTSDVIWTVSSTLLELRYQTECVVYFGIEYLFLIFTKHLNLLVKEAIKKVSLDNNGTVKDVPISSDAVTKNEVKRWATIYRQLMMSSKLLQACFSLQVLF